MQDPLFSIITVTLNPGDGLAQTIESVRAQQFRDFEHIIKDGGSVDGSLERHASGDPGYSPLIIRERDTGIYDAMNQALIHARGTYVVFLNAGDCFYDGGVLERVARAVSQEPPPGLVYGDYFSCPLQLVVKSPRRLSRFFLYRTTLCHQSCFTRRDAIEQLKGFDTSFRVVADYDLLLRLVLSAGISCRYLDQTLASSMGFGFTAQPDNIRRGLEEAGVLRRRHFGAVDRALYGCLRAATLPGLRMRLMRTRHLTGLKRIYSEAVNSWNRGART